MAISSSTNAVFEGKIVVQKVSLEAGAGAPSHAAAKGSLYIRTDGSSTSTRVYVCSVATGTWVNLTASA